MPVYSYRCANCDRVEEAIRCIADRHRGPYCDQSQWCGLMDLVIDPVRGIVKDPAVPRRQK